MRAVHLLLFCTALATLTPPLLAQPEDPARAKAVELYGAGQEAYAAGRFKDAIDYFLQADATKRSASFAYNIALAYEQMGDDAKTLQWAREYVRRKPAAGDRATMDALVERMQKSLAAKGLQQVTVLSTPPGATVHVNGAPAGVTPWTGTLSPKEHVLYLEAAGREPTTHAFVLPADRAIDVMVTLPERQPQPAAPVAPVAPTTAPVAPTRVDDGATVSWWTWTALGLGAAGLGASLTFELLRAGAESDAQDAMTQIEAGEHADRMESHQLAARVTLGLGAGFAALGAGLLIVDLMSDDADIAMTADGLRWRF